MAEESSQLKKCAGQGYSCGAAPDFHRLPTINRLSDPRLRVIGGRCVAVSLLDEDADNRRSQRGLPQIDIGHPRSSAYGSAIIRVLTWF